MVVFKEEALLPAIFKARFELVKSLKLGEALDVRGKTGTLAPVWEDVKILEGASKDLSLRVRECERARVWAWACMFKWGDIGTGRLWT